MTTLESKRSPFHGAGFLAGAMAAPGLSVVLCFVGGAVTSLASSGSTDGWLEGAGVMFVIAFIVTLWGLVPSFVFGGLVLAVIHALPQQRWSARLVYGTGGMIAAGLYVLVSELIDGLRQGSAFLFAPWTLMGPEVASTGGLWWVWLSIAAGGLGAGLIYAGFVKRG